MTNPMPRPIGIIGGYSPRAGVLLLDRLAQAAMHALGGPHVPVILHQGLIPYSYGETPSATPVRAFREIIRGLEAAGAIALAMPSARAHAYAPELAGATDLPFIDMLQATASATQADGRIAVLAPPAFRRMGLLNAYLPGNPAVLEDETPLTLLLQQLAQGAEPAALAPALHALVSRLEDQADTVVIVGSELSQITPYLPEQGRWVDAMDCLVDAVITAARTHAAPAGFYAASYRAGAPVDHAR